MNFVATSAMPSFSLLTYATPNLGDDIQSVAAERFLPRVDCLVNRDRLSEAPACAVILNGWFLHARRRSDGSEATDWPPPPRIRPLLISFHAHALPGITSPESAAYLKDHAPVGCRDLATRAALAACGVPASFSGCLTLTLERAGRRRRSGVYLVDVPEPIRRGLPTELLEKAVALTHVTHECDAATRFALARDLLRIYSDARLVVTTRLHAALPCAAFETPVLLVHPHLDRDPRFSGLLPLVHHVTPSAPARFRLPLDWRNPPPNPGPDLRVSLRARLTSACRQFVSRIGAGWSP